MISDLLCAMCCNPVEEYLFSIMCANKTWEKVVEQGVAKKGMRSPPFERGMSRSSSFKTC